MERAGDITRNIVESVEACDNIAAQRAQRVLPPFHHCTSSFSHYPPKVTSSYRSYNL